MPKTGKIPCITGVFEWKIDDFFSLSTKNKEAIQSPLFSFAGEYWFLNIYPNGENKSSAGWISMFLHREIPGAPIYLAYSLSLKTFEGKKYLEKSCSYIFEKTPLLGYGYEHFMARSQLLEERSELGPDDILTIVCTFWHYSTSLDDAGNIMMVHCPLCEKAWGADYISAHHQKCLKKRITKKQLKDFGNILQNKEHSDITIKVKGTEFALHRNILSSRSLYFNAMFKTEMREKTTGVVSIDDCDPDIFKIFIKFLYMGEALLSHDNVCASFEIADKYQEDDLKEECLWFMQNKVSVDSFCVFTAFALKYNEDDLLENMSKFFCLKVKEIIVSEKWKEFMKEYPNEANELYVKAAHHGIDKTI